MRFSKEGFVVIKEMFREVIWGTFKDVCKTIVSKDSSFADRCMAALMLLLFGSLGLLGFVLIDSAGIAPAKTAVTVVEVKQVVPARTTTNVVGKVIVSQYQPESYRLHFKIDGEEVSPTVEKKLFDDVKVGDRIEVDYGFGRLSNSHQATKIKLVGR